MIRLLIADDHELFREGLKSLLAREKDIDLVAACSDGSETMAAVAKLRPDVILMDVTMPHMNGIVATQKICAENPQAVVIMLSMHNDRRFIAEALKAGAKGYLLKESSPELVVEAIHTVYNGDYCLPPKVCTVLIEDYLRLLECSSEPGKSPLSDRESEVLRLLVKGRSTKQIADTLAISKNTVDTHRRRIMDKLGCEGMAELTRYAIREGLLTLD